MVSKNLVTLFSTLNRHRVNYVVVGGFAVNFYGYQRFTKDIDLLVSLTSEDLSNLLAALQELEFRPIYPIDLEEFCNEEKRKQWVTERNMTVFSVVSDLLPTVTLDLFVDPPYLFNEIKEQRNYDYLDGDIPIPIIDLQHLIEMKEKVGRDQDKIDVEYLKKLKDEYL
ncbi:nucleotidyl transferase AbiEii/AbiGii toxin family protein [Akkermansiaceae bacterium]|nr:nucleotidyl transferase AbiEii/AbiGii toxin family protein [Akkermansiaceae bacterium]